MEPRSYEHVGWRTSKNSSKYDPVPVGPDFVVEEPYCNGDDLYLYALWTPNDFYLTKQPQDVTLDPKGGKHDRESMAVEISHPEYLDKIEYQCTRATIRTTARGSSLFRAPPAMTRAMWWAPSILATPTTTTIIIARSP